MDPVTITTIIADDDPLVRAGLSMIVQGGKNIELVGQVDNGRAAIAMVEQLRPDVVLMDIRMPVLDGIAATEELMKGNAPPRVIILTTFDGDDFVMRALAAGAAGFLLKDTPPADIVDAIGRVVDGEPMLSPTVTEQLINHVTHSAGANPASAKAISELTSRERDVALAVGRGSSNAEIAAELFMSVATVKVHISHIFEKLGVNNRVQVAISMHNAGLL